MRKPQQSSCSPAPASGRAESFLPVCSFYQALSRVSDGSSGDRTLIGRFEAYWMLRGDDHRWEWPWNNLRRKVWTNCYHISLPSHISQRTSFRLCILCADGTESKVAPKSANPVACWLQHTVTCYSRCITPFFPLSVLLSSSDKGQ